MHAAGYLTRPPAQRLRAFEKRGGQPHLYTLGTKGAHELRALGFTLPRKDFDRKANEWKPHSFDHPLLITHTLAPLLLAFRRSPRFTITALFPDGAFHEHIRVVHDGRLLELPIAPDTLFTLTDAQTDERLAFFLEMDCGTEPPTRKDFNRSSFAGKLLAYAAAWRDRTHFLRTHEIEADDLLVLTITATASRATSLCTLAARMDEHARSLFWFTNAAQLTTTDPAALPFASLWTTAAGDVGPLFDLPTS